MKKLNEPKFDAQTTFRDCISIVKNADLSKRLSKCERLIVEAESEFSSKITKGKIHTIVEEEIVNKNVSAKELEKVYTFRMAKKGTPGRVIYDKIISAPELGICPLCNHRLVETLDHYLPKANYPRLTVTPVNLIPACFPCNKKKLTAIPQKAKEETLHPYYDDIENEKWLFATVNKTTPATLTYYVKSPISWSSLLKGRVEHHFYSFSLGQLYSIQAAVLLRNLSKRLEGIHKKLGEGGVKKYLSEEAKSRNYVDKNSWQTVFYKTLANNRWFCNGGFKIK